MCGIVGLWDRRARRSEPETLEILGRMTDSMVRRGPDASGVWVDQVSGLALGHRRLSILDLSEHGAQPMHSADGRWVITYNGEVYDHAELAGDLESAGVRLRGRSDTEVLVEAIARWGIVPTLQRLDGMFAFAVWDRRERRLTLARDRIGEKPLYFGSLRSGEFVFGSTLDALRAHEDFDLEVDRDALASYFRYKYVPAPWSIYSGISKLDPGCTVEVSADGSIGDAVPFWSFFDVIASGAAFQGSAAEAVDELDRLLRRSVRRRMQADVPVGAFLSGGIDSSTIVAVAQEESSQPVRTYTIGSSDADYDESDSARRVAEHLGADHTELIVSDAEVLEVIESLGGIYDEPFGDSSQVPTFMVSELARQDVTVVLSGDGGDELFAGYNRHAWVPSIWRQLDRVPSPVRSGGARLASQVPPSWWDRAALALPERRRPRQLGLKMAKVVGIADADDEYEVFNRLVSHWQDPNRLVRGAIEPSTIHSDPARWPADTDIVGHMTAVDTVTYLPDDVLTKVDRATMAVSLEGRVPLLDRSIVEFAAGLPQSMKTRDGKSKWPLRQVLGRYVPVAMFDRPKAGFGLPIETWLRGPLRPWAEHHLFGPTAGEFLDPELISVAWKQHLAGTHNRAYELWDVIMFSVWSEHRSIVSA